MAECCLKRKPSRETFKYRVLSQLLKASSLINVEHFQLKSAFIETERCKKRNLP